MDFRRKKLYFSFIVSCAAQRMEAGVLADSGLAKRQPVFAREGSPADGAVASFGLYGETEGASDPEFFHIEDIQSRSRLYRWQINAHMHRRLFQLIWVSAGPVTADLDGRVTTLEGPCAICVPGSTVHSFIFSEETRGHVVTVSEALLLEDRSGDRQGFFQPLLTAAAVAGPGQGFAEQDTIAALLEQMSREYRLPSTGRNEIFGWLFKSVLLLLQRQLADAGTARGHGGYRRQIFNRFVQLLEERFRDQWNAGRFADALALSPARLNRLCREYAGKSAMEMLHDRLTLEAQRHLIYSTAPVELIAYDIGFKDAGYFCRFFKRRTGMTPAAFRRQRDAG